MSSVTLERARASFEERRAGRGALQEGPEPSSAEAWAQRAWACFRAYDAEEGYRAAARGAAQFPQDVGCLDALLLLSYWTARFEEMLPRCEQRIARKSKSESFDLTAWHNFQAKALLHLERYAEGLSVIDHALPLERSPVNLSVKAWLYDTLKLPALARDTFYQVIWDTQSKVDANTKEVLVWNERSFALLYLRRFDESLEAADMALSIQPGYFIGYKNKGRALVALKEYEEARGWLQLALECQPRWGEAAFYLAKAHAGRKDTDAARAALALLPALSPYFAALAAEELSLRLG